MFFVKPARLVNKVFIHCSASDNLEHDNVAIIALWHKARSFETIGYHYIITKDGNIHLGRDVEKIPAAQEGHNTGSIAICLTGKEVFSQQQFDALKKLCLEIAIVYDNAVTFHGHCEVNKNKSCPNFDYKKLLSLSHDGRLNGRLAVDNARQSDVLLNGNMSINFENVLKTISKVAPTVGGVFTNPIGTGIGLLCELIGAMSTEDAKDKVKNMPVEQLAQLEKRMQMQLELQKVELEECKMKHIENLRTFEDRRHARDLFSHSKLIIAFGMIMAAFGMITIVYFTYKSMFIDDQHLHFVREVKAFIEGSVLMLVMQYFFGSAHKG